ncbi:TIM barrel protein [Peptoniphilus sp. KCTC 25270]|uniref:sugar phosphate isomerase/epimerase family protein n=1 Tax=Peptoniphilus sp. KCTC 25270 TaxID=2897414 RepID=UPI001E5D6885|nr:TIM barrel protein [Peptoniphilus sp. KCTC 25270]MCD1147993.1 TIM barrel protein [Peptoniphilus sp. KCTC 25270]
MRRISLSTNIFGKIEDFEEIEMFLPEGFNLEIFPLWQDDKFEKILEKKEDYLRGRTKSFHSPYYFTEPSLGKEHPDYNEMMKNQEKTMKWAHRLGAKYIVFHHNNKKIEEEKNMKKNSEENYCILQEKARSYGLDQVVENVGIQRKENLLYDEKEFMELALIKKYPILLDVGHMHCNEWDVEKVIYTLRKQIVAYHIHDNNQKSDEHKRIFEGSFPMMELKNYYKKYTKNADLIIEYGPNPQIGKKELEEGGRWLMEHFALCSF